MTTRSRIAMAIYGLVNAVLFGVGAVAVLVFASEEQWKHLLPAVILGSLLLAVPGAWFVAPRLRAGYHGAGTAVPRSRRAGRPKANAIQAESAG